jgi:FkbM family methyltransferase
MVGKINELMGGGGGMIAKTYEVVVRVLCTFIPLKNLRHRIRNFLTRNVVLLFSGVRVDVYDELGCGWMEYMLTNNMKERVETLRKNLDDKSLKLLERLLSRPFFANRNAKFKRAGLYCEGGFYNSLFSEEEIEDRKKIRLQYKKCKKTFCLTHRFAFLSETFFYNSGLVNKSEKLKNYIAGKDFIDGGAYIGDTALMYIKLYNPRKVYSFDISPKNIDRYAKTMKLNKISPDKYEILFLGLSDSQKTISIDDDGNGGTTSLSKGSVTVELKDLDTFAKDNKLHVGFIKTDLEGGDFDALKGMTETIRRDRPVLALSIYHNPRDFFEMKPFLENVVSDLNYKITIEKHSPERILAETVVFAYPKELDD